MKAKSEVPELKMLTTRIPVELHRALKIHAAETGKTVSVIVESLVRQMLRGKVKA